MPRSGSVEDMRWFKGDPSFVRFQVQSRPTEKEIGTLCHLQQGTVEIQVAPGESKPAPTGDPQSKMNIE